uniref:WGS project CAEQ00000000 data, annotated contig 1340 n=1 Tax=Trypanosoma congolense (strain IL3000) TaxID=1068625 RepID=F9W5L9_TRYCI|nr:unnamed protein product [Trypanosoma congolense IL3000]
MGYSELRPSHPYSSPGCITVTSCRTSSRPNSHGRSSGTSSVRRQGSRVYDPLNASRNGWVRYDSSLARSLLNTAKKIDERRSCHSSLPNLSSPSRSRTSYSRMSNSTASTVGPSSRARMCFEPALSGYSPLKKAKLLNNGATAAGGELNAKQLTNAFYGSNTSGKFAEAAYLHFVADINRQQMQRMGRRRR